MRAPASCASASSTWIVSPRRSLLSCSGRALDHDPAAVDDRELRGEPVGLLEVVGGEQDRHPLLGGEPLDLPPHLGSRLGIEARRRLVEEQHVRAVEQSHGDVQAALHAAGVGLRLAVGGIGEAEALERLCDPAAELGAGDPVELALQDEVLATGRLRIGSVLLPDDADRAAYRHRVGEHVYAATRALPLSGRVSVVSTRTVVDLPGAVGAQQAEDRSRLHR